MLQALDHVTVRSSDLSRTQRFYESALGLERGARPAFQIGGHWLYLAGRPVLHVVEAAACGTPAGAFDHFAFAARGRDRLEACLAAAGVPFQLRQLPDGSALQMKMRDPDGACIELVFYATEDL